MNYGTGAAPSLAGITILPFIGNNVTLFAIAAGLIVLGVSVMAMSFVLARKGRIKA